jgi:hypothetical protein
MLEELSVYKEGDFALRLHIRDNPVLVLLS